MIDDATVFRLGQDNFRFVGGDEYDGIWLRELADRERLEGLDQAGDRPAAQHRRPGTGEPRGARADRLDAADPADACRELKWFRFLVGRIGTYDGIPIIVSRTGYTGELGYEVFCHPSDARGRLGRGLGRRASRCGVKPLGLEALDMLRIESGLIFAGYEFDDQVDPFEAGIGFSVALDGRGGLRRPRRAASSARPTRSGSSSASSWTATRSPVTATRSTSAAGASASSRAAPAARC